MKNSKLIKRAVHRAINSEYATLQIENPQGKMPNESDLTDEHTEVFFSLKNSAELRRGWLTGLIGTAILFFISTELWAPLDGLWGGIERILAVLIFAFIISFTIESLRELPLSTVFNRRTREIYFDKKGELFHTPWDDIHAITYKYKSGLIFKNRLPDISLEILMHRFGEPGTEKALIFNFKKDYNSDFSGGFWEYLRAYMENGPWFDKTGEHSKSDTHIKNLIIHNRAPFYVWHHNLKLMIEERKERNRRNWLGGSEAGLLLCYPACIPAHIIQHFICKIARQRTQNRWPEIVRERLRADGPTTRLIDLERERGLNV